MRAARRLTLFLVAVLAARAGGAQSSVAVLPGLDFSSNLGEVPVAPALRLSAAMGAARWLEVELFHSTAGKIASTGEARGWVAQGRSTIVASLPHGSRFFLLAGADYTHRNGGEWAKKVLSLEAGAGVRWRSPTTGHVVRLAYRQAAVGSRNCKDDGVRSLGLEYRFDRRLGRRSPWSLRLDARQALYRYEAGSPRLGLLSRVALGTAYSFDGKDE